MKTRLFDGRKRAVAAVSDGDCDNTNRGRNRADAGRDAGRNFAVSQSLSL